MDELEAELNALAVDGYVPATPAPIYRAILAETSLKDRGRRYLEGRGFDAETAYSYGFRSIDGPQDWSRLQAMLLAGYLGPELARAGFPRRTDTSGNRVDELNLPYRGVTAALLIPYVSGGEIVAIRFRRLDGRREHRYHTLGGTHPPVPFNADALHDVAGRILHVTEGELNAYALRSAGHIAIGLPGANVSWRHEWSMLVRDAKRIAFWFDADEAGDKGAERLASALQAHLGMTWLATRAVRVRTVADANDLHLQGELNGILADVRWN